MIYKVNYCIMFKETQKGSICAIWVTGSGFGKDVLSMMGV